MDISVFDIFKIGIGPSSSHTVGPMRAARRFAERLVEDGMIASTAAVKVELFGSLGFTGKGHGSDRAVILGLEGEDPAKGDIARSGAASSARRRPSARAARHPTGRVRSGDRDRVPPPESLRLHSNGMRFTRLPRG